MSNPRIQFFSRNLKNSKWRVREESAEARGEEVDDTEAMPYVFDALPDQDWHIREAAALALGLMDDKRAVKPLIAVLDDLKSNCAWEERWYYQQWETNLRYLNCRNYYLMRTKLLKKWLHLLLRRFIRRGNKSYGEKDNVPYTKWRSYFLKSFNFGNFIYPNYINY